MRSDAMWLSMALAADAHAAVVGREDAEDSSLESGFDEDWGDEYTGRRDTAERLLNRFLALCENPRTSDRMLNLVKSSLEHEGSGRRFYLMFNTMVLSPVMRLGGLKGGALRGELVASQLVGLAMMRYVIKVEPVCSLEREVVVQMMAPAIRATLRGE
jgi:hypothetical protein